MEDGRNPSYECIKREDVTMLVIIDGYNFIGRSRKLRIKDPNCREKLIRDLTEYCRFRKKEIIVVFDGSYLGHVVDKKRTYGRITVVYSSAGSTADEEIGKLIRANQQKADLLIVTSDNEVKSYAQSMGTQVARAEDFEQDMENTFTRNSWKMKDTGRVLKKKRKIDRVHVHLSEREIQEWIRVFTSAQKPT